jgi:hypothetical protein
MYKSAPCHSCTWNTDEELFTFLQILNSVSLPTQAWFSRWIFLRVSRCRHTRLRPPEASTSEKRLAPRRFSTLRTPYRSLQRGSGKPGQEQGHLQGGTGLERYRGSQFIMSSWYDPHTHTNINTHTHTHKPTHKPHKHIHKHTHKHTQTHT